MPSSPARVAWLLARAGDLRSSGRPERAVRYYRRAGRLAARRGQSALRAAAQAGYGAAARDRRRFSEAVVPLRAAALAYQRLGDRRGLSYALRNLGVARRHLGHLHQASRLLRASRRLATVAGDPPGAAVATLHLAITERLRGDLHLAAALLRASAEQLRAVGRPHQPVVAGLHLGLTELAAGRTGQARRLLLESLVGFTRLGEEHWVAVNLFCLAQVPGGGTERADAYLADARARFAELGDGWWLRRLDQSLARAATTMTTGSADRDAYRAARDAPSGDRSSDAGDPARSTGSGATRPRGKDLDGRKGTSMSGTTAPRYRYVRSFTSLIERDNLDAVKKIYYDEFLPALATGPRPYQAHALIELADDASDVVEAVIHTRWESLDALHEAMGIEQVGTSLMRMLLLNKERPKIATYVIDDPDAAGDGPGRP
ncbi:hypothetical protein ABNF97_31395 [Plantactinospora sp. B6F1]|uniref:hypothetical protein n=1 Tax=Plantactinospora sp. B6F1 TaxID=3158971 RepID=UPI0032D932AD